MNQMKVSVFLMLLVLGTERSLTNSFSTGSTACRTKTIDTTRMSLGADTGPFDGDSSTDSENGDSIIPARRDFLQQSSSLAGAAALLSWNPAPAFAALPSFGQSSPDVENVDQFEVFKTASGLKYIELEEGTIGDSSKTPQYGQLCVISYTGYMQLPKDNKKIKFGSQSGFVLKHGNGKMISGFDEGLHTMKRGGRRRLIIPPKLGFVSIGLGPLPELPWERRKLNSLLSEMVNQRGGNLIYDVTLERFFDDEADQGYYEDDEISPEEFSELNRRLNRKNAGAVLDAVGDDIEIDERDREKPIV